jgi:uncharacterized protein YjbJ (UPF0337 family)
VRVPERRGDGHLLDRGGKTMGIGDDDKAEGAWDKTKGKVKKAYGELTDDPDKKAEGSWDKTKGSIKDTKGDVKNKIEKGLDDV